MDALAEEYDVRITEDVYQEATSNTNYHKDAVEKLKVLQKFK